jgi:hypothetical protein
MINSASPIQTNTDHLSVTNAVEVTYDLIIPYGRLNEGYKYTTAYNAYIDLTGKLSEAITQTSQFTSLIREMSGIPVYTSTFATASSDFVGFNAFTSTPTSAPQSNPSVNKELTIEAASGDVSKDNNLVWILPLVIGFIIICIVIVFVIYRRLRGTDKAKNLANEYSADSELAEFAPSKGDVIEHASDMKG